MLGLEVINSLSASIKLTKSRKVKIDNDLGEVTVNLDTIHLCGLWLTPTTPYDFAEHASTRCAASS